MVDFILFISFSTTAKLFLIDSLSFFMIAKILSSFSKTSVIDSERSMLDMLIDYEQKNPNCEPIWEYSRRIEWNDESRNKDTIYHPNMFGYKLIGKHIYSKIKDKKIDPNNKIKNNKLL